MSVPKCRARREPRVLSRSSATVAHRRRTQTASAPTTNASGTAVFNLSDDLTSTSSVGTQYLRETLHRIYAFGSVLTPGVETSLAGATNYFESGEDNTLNATVSAYGQQRFGWRDRVFVSAAVRGDVTARVEELGRRGDY